MIIVTGADGMLGRQVVLRASRRGVLARAYGRNDLNIANPRHVQKIHPSSTVINCAGIVKGRQDTPRSEMIAANALGPHRVAEQCRRLIHISTDCVFDGEYRHPYPESWPPCPKDLYGISKLCGEVRHGDHLTVRTSFIGWGKRGLLRWLLDQPPNSKVDGYINWWWSGLYVGTVAQQLIDWALDPGMTGLIHCHGPRITKHALLDRLAKTWRPDVIVDTVLDSERDMSLRSERQKFKFEWDGMLQEMKRDFSGHSSRAQSRI